MERSAVAIVVLASHDAIDFTSQKLSRGDSMLDKPSSQPQRNVFGEPLQSCSERPRTGFYRTGCCHTGPEDVGLHTVCVEVTAEFLAFSKAAGNDLSTPHPEHGFPGLKPGDRWCLCAARWREAFEAGRRRASFSARRMRRRSSWSTRRPQALRHRPRLRSGAGGDAGADRAGHARSAKAAIAVADSWRDIAGDSPRRNRRPAPAGSRW